MVAYGFVLAAAIALVVGWLGQRSVVLLGAVIAAAVALAALGFDEWLRRSGTVHELALLDVGSPALHTDSDSPGPDAAGPAAEGDVP